MTFDEYYRDTYPTALGVIAKRLLEKTPIKQIERVALRLMFLLENNLLCLPHGTGEASAFTVLAAKASNECLGFIACMNGCSYWSAQHHARAMIELLVASHHLVCKAEDRAARFQRYVEYADLFHYQMHLRQLKQIEDGQLTKEVFDAQARWVSPANVERFEQKAAQWKELYGKKQLLKVQHWHSPASLTELIVDYDTYRGGIGLWRRYELLCQGTHVSPIGHRGVAAPGIPLLGLPTDDRQLFTEVASIGDSLVRCVQLWDERLIPGSRLMDRISAELGLLTEAIVVLTA